jgi:hypothetical protein
MSGNAACLSHAAVIIPSAICEFVAGLASCPEHGSTGNEVLGDDTFARISDLAGVLSDNAPLLLIITKSERQ